MKGENKITYQDDKILKFFVESPKYGNKEVIIDFEDWVRIKQYRWYYHYQPNENKSYIVADKWIKNKRYNIRLHRLIMDVTDSKIEVDHIFAETLDNRKKVLRVCTREENTRNVKKRVTNTSGFKGVSWHKKLGKWRVRIKTEHVGVFDKQDIHEAALAYNISAIKKLGEFACLNYF
jgi:hypothetical protein